MVQNTQLWLACFLLRGGARLGKGTPFLGEALRESWDSRPSPS